ncbi:hypothetical protein Acsp03_58300 [Actinomadura sp. NBRC 104412]|uniref:hypothetical protein n=1 Tax=Actinomadura sp. NBRC 104412 TaxID=3032203 RepID=UPI0024A11A0A|nr:hypothetical protein [Actinomadura sp. NBRC 104412]GLZ08364.1 hypothetical protein Acsp03_58300 [Actinomadura sp. NBRC 104412]
MNKLTDYVLAVRTAGSPPGPEGIKTVDLVPGEGDITSSTLDALRTSGLIPEDFRSRVIYLAPEGPGCLVPYTALCGFAGRRVDAYAGGTVLEFSRLDQEDLPDAGRPPGHLMWAQVGGPAAEGIPTVHLDPDGGATPEAVSVIRYAARLRMVPPESAHGALVMLMIVAAIRRRTEDRFPYLSTGTEPAPVTKADPNQGIDLENIRRGAARHRQLLRAGRRGAEVVPPVPVSDRNKRLTRANNADIRVVLRRLGSSPEADDAGHWHCPRARRHRHGDRNPSMTVYKDNRARCQHCDAEKIGPLRLIVDVLGLTPDEAATFILESDRAIGAHAG